MVWVIWALLAIAAGWALFNPFASLIGVSAAGYSVPNFGRDTWYFFAEMTAAAGFVSQKEVRGLERKTDSKNAIDASVALAEVKA